MEDASKIREFLRKTLLDSYRDEYKELADIWRGLETKAQGNIAIAGIFIAVVFAFIREAGQQSYWAERACLGLALIFLVISVIFSIMVLRVRQAPFPPMGGFVDKMFIDHLNIKDDAELLERLPLLINDQAKAWRQVKEMVVTSNKSKARNLWAAQVFLLAAILTFATLTLLRIISRG